MTSFSILLLLQVVFSTNVISLYIGQPKAPLARHPVILIPGLEGSRLEAKLDKSHSRYMFCDRKKDWHTIWLEIENFGPLKSMCFKENFKLNYNVSSRHVYNQDGVQIRPFKFGDTEGIEFIDPVEVFTVVSLFGAMVEALVALNYTRNKDLRGAPYDFRKSFYDNEEFLIDFKDLIEETYSNNDNTPVYLVSHSLGGLYTLNFLNLQDQVWKDKYIKGFIPISAPWGGAGAALAAIAIGDNFGVSLVKKKDYRDLERSLSTIYSLLPSVASFGDQTLVSQNGVNYTANDYDAIFDLYNLPNGKLMYQDSKYLTMQLPHPKVAVYCVHGNGHDTVESLSYEPDRNFPDSPDISNGPGDGTVNIGSLSACKIWSCDPKYKFEYAVFDGVDHVGSISNAKVIEFLAEILSTS